MIILLYTPMIILRIYYVTFTRKQESFKGGNYYTTMAVLCTTYYYYYYYYNCYDNHALSSSIGISSHQHHIRT